MAHTNSTPNYNLPQFLPTDKPAWLVDVNPAYASIDTAIKNASDAADDAQEDATQALADAAGANAIATQADSKAAGAIASISEQFLDTATYEVGEYVIFNNILYVCTEPVTTPGPWTGSINWARTSLDSIATDLNSSINNLEDRTGSDINVSDSSEVKIDAAIANATPKVAILTSSMNCSFSDNKTIGYRSTSSDIVNLAALPNYPTGHTILGFIVQYAYVGEVGEFYNAALINIDGTNVHCNSKVAGIVRFAIRALYL